jgi:hypothetical protein
MLTKIKQDSMSYKMKQDKSPATNPAGSLDFLTTSGTGGGYINPAQQSSAAGAAGGGFSAGGAGAITGLAGGLVNEFGESDPTKGGYTGTKVTSKALEYAGMGAMLGPYGMAAGALIGAGVGAFGAKKDREEAEKQQLIQEQNEGMLDAKQQLMKNKMGVTKKGPIKKLGAITGTMSPNMAMVQYKNENKFKSIAQKLEEDKIVDVLDSSTGKRTKLTKKDGSYYKAGQLVNLTKNQKEFNKPDLLPKNDKPTKKQK